MNQTQQQQQKVRKQQKKKKITHTQTGAGKVPYTGRGVEPYPEKKPMTAKIYVHYMYIETENVAYRTACHLLYSLSFSYDDDAIAIYWIPR